MTKTVEMSEQKPKRPLGVWLLTIYAAVFAGIVPLIAAIFLLASGNTRNTMGVNVFSLIFSILLNVSIITSAIGAWQGKARARQALLILITLHYVLVGVNNFFFLNSQQIAPEQQARLWGRVLRGLLYPALYIWYFRRETTRAFYMNPLPPTEPPAD